LQFCSADVDDWNDVMVARKEFVILGDVYFSELVGENGR